MKLSLAFGTLALALISSAYSAVVINEALVSTTSTDGEFIELYNSGLAPVDLQGWSILEYESDTANAAFGSLDDTFSIPTGSAVTLNPGDFYLIGNAQFVIDFGITPDLELPLSVENSSVTLVLQNAAAETQYVALLNDGDGDANEAGVSVTPDISVGPDGAFLPAGYYLTPDGGSTAGILEFSPKPAASATPGASNIPEPSAALLGGLALLLGLRRRR